MFCISLTCILVLESCAITSLNDVKFPIVCVFIYGFIWNPTFLCDRQSQHKQANDVHHEHSFQKDIWTTLSVCEGVCAGVCVCVQILLKVSLLIGHHPLLHASQSKLSGCKILSPKRLKSGFPKTTPEEMRPDNPSNPKQFQELGSLSHCVIRSRSSKIRRVGGQWVVLDVGSREKGRKQEEGRSNDLLEKNPKTAYLISHSFI